MLCRSSTAFSLCEHQASITLLMRETSADPDRLLFMTYNGWVMLSVAVGAFVGYLAFGDSSSTKSVACH